jgi:hypothetical protein
MARRSDRIWWADERQQAAITGPGRMTAFTVGDRVELPHGDVQAVRKRRVGRRLAIKIIGRNVVRRMWWR